jgi:tetratricopeptide (TPR) repeat protein
MTDPRETAGLWPELDDVVSRRGFAWVCLLSTLSALLPRPGPAVAQGAAVPDAPFARGQQALGLRGAQYGLLPATSPPVQRVDAVFQRLVNAAGRRPGAFLEAHVLDTPRVLAEALPGGFVVISLGAVDITNGDDDALAFLLGHEIAHILRDHHGLIQAEGQAAAPPEPPSVRARQAMELEADRLGVLYAALAGYRARAAIPVLGRIVAATGSSPLHPEPARRATAMRSGIRQIAAQVELFGLGLVYLVVHRYEEAVRVYETLATLYPGREIYSNLGAAHHRWARVFVADDGWVRGVSVDARTRARTSLRGQSPEPGRKHPLFRRHLEQALANYGLAVASDPDYAVGHDNLGLAHLDEGELDLALGHLSRALRTDPALKTAWNHRGIVHAYRGDAARAESDFLRAASIDPAFPAPHANLARLHEARGSSELAATERQIAQRLYAAEGGVMEAAAEPERLGELAPGMQAAAAARNRPQLIPFTLPMGLRSDEALSVWIDESARLLIAARRGWVDVVGALDGHRGATARGLRIGSPASRARSLYGAPTTVERGPGGDLWIYAGPGLVVLVREAVEAWWLVPAEGRG